jgi:small subunit ribosomal protein S16
MSIKIRLSRGGRKGVPFYKIVVANSTSPRDGKFIEKLGIHNPSLDKDNKDRTIVNKERAEYWLSVGATPSDRVALMLIGLGVKGADKYKPKFTPKKKGDGAKKKALEAAAKAKEAAEAAAAKAAEPKEEAAAA